MELQQIKLAQALLDEEDAEKKEAALVVELEKFKQQKNKSTAILTDLKADIQYFSIMQWTYFDDM